jgi:hypothetical protein
MASKSDLKSTLFWRRPGHLPTLEFVYRFFWLLFLTGLGIAPAVRADLRSVPSTSAGPGLPFAVADFDGDLRPDLAVVHIGRSDASRTEYWIRLQLSGAGTQTILIAAPTGGLQIAVRDVNGDHALDLVVTTAWLKQPIAILLNDGHGSFSRVEPDAFPEAFSESRTGWSLATHQRADAVGILPQSRAGVCQEARGFLTDALRADSISLTSVRYVRNSFLASDAGRAPPSIVTHL